MMEIREEEMKKKATIRTLAMRKNIFKEGGDAMAVRSNGDPRRETDLWIRVAGRTGDEEVVGRRRRQKLRWQQPIRAADQAANQHCGKATTFHVLCRHGVPGN
jgi:hypothetical protein